MIYEWKKMDTNTRNIFYVYFHALANFVYIITIGFQTITADASDYVKLLDIVLNDWQICTKRQNNVYFSQRKPCV